MARGAGKGGGGGLRRLFKTFPSKGAIIRGNTVYRPPEIFRSIFTDLTDPNHHKHTLCRGKITPHLTSLKSLRLDGN